jgi:hypothetical protein
MQTVFAGLAGVFILRNWSQKVPLLCRDGNREASAARPVSGYKSHTHMHKHSTLCLPLQTFGTHCFVVLGQIRALGHATVQRYSE